MKLFIDIETIPSQKPGVLEEIRKNIKHPGNISKPETIEKWYAENADNAAQEEWRKQSFDGLYGEIISIAWAFDDESPEVLYREQGEEESKLLNVFFKEIKHLLISLDGKPEVISQWIGHYISGFDLRFLWQRCVVNGVRPTVNIPYDAKPWDDKIFDTKVAWSGSGQYSGKSSLDALCKAFGFEGKGDIDGSKVFDYWLAGRYAEIAEYNKQDVIKCRQLYKKMTFQS
jgi:predicted PolB exonuclease-like 3'-5' exonuclease